MRVLITNPPAIIGNKTYDRAGARWPAKKKLAENKRDLGRYTPFPFFMAYTSALLKQDSHKVFVVDAGSLQMPEDEYMEELKKRPSDLVLIETATPTNNLDLAYAKKIKELIGAKIILVGPHASIFPQEMLKNSFVDFVAVGEYEYTVKELVNKLEYGGKLDNVKGLAYKEGSQIKINEKRSVIEPLDDLPFPDRDSFPIDSNPDVSIYWDGFCEIFPCVQMVSTRGCPYNCDFCLWTQTIYPGRKFRLFSAKRVVDEMELCIKKYGAKEIYFDDDTFMPNKKHVLEICDEIKKRKLDIPWCVMGDSMSSDRETIKAMSEAGCIGMKFGVESMDSGVLKNIDKPIREQKTIDFAKWLREFNIRSHATFSFGLNSDTLESMKKTLTFAGKLDVDSVQFSVSIPYPGTRYYETAKKNGWLTETEWDNYDGRALVNLPGLSAEQIQSFFNIADFYWKTQKIKDIRWVMNRVGRTYKYRGLNGLAFIIKRGMKYVLPTNRQKYNYSKIFSENKPQMVKVPAPIKS